MSTALSAHAHGQLPSACASGDSPAAAVTRYLFPAARWCRQDSQERRLLRRRTSQRVTQGVTTGCSTRLVRVAGAPIERLLATNADYADFRRLHPVLSPLERNDMVPAGDVIPIHPAAVAYYREVHLAP